MSAIFGTKFTSLQPYASSEAKMMKICGFFDPATHIPVTGRDELRARYDFSRRQ
ncbi:hypothetical protein E4U14_003731, partial [Claviceps sp. LM454 group G7]